MRPAAPRTPSGTAAPDVYLTGARPPPSGQPRITDHATPRNRAPGRPRIEDLRMDDETPLVTQLVAAALRGDTSAWKAIVERYSMLVVGVVRRYRLPPSEVEDVAQTVWLRAVEHLAALREPRALPMWLIRTAQREAARAQPGRQRSSPHGPDHRVWDVEATTEDLDEELVRLERREALLAGLAELSARHRDLLLLMLKDPPLSYAEIHHLTGIPVGSIGPTRGRALERLRQTAALQAVMAESDRSDQVGGDRRDEAALG